MEETHISDKSQDMNYAGFWVRLGAYILDGLFFSLCFMALSYTPLFDTLTTPLFHFEVYGESVPFLDGSTVLFVTAILFMWTVWGVDVGKYLLNLKIIDAKGHSRLGLWQSVWRFLGYIVSSLSFGLGFIAIGLTKDKRGFHDSIAKTRVVYHSHGFLSSVSNPVLRLFLFGGIMFGVSVWGEWQSPLEKRIAEWEREVEAQIEPFTRFNYNPEDFPEHQRAFFESECYSQLKMYAGFRDLDEVICDLDKSVTGIPYLPEAWLPQYKKILLKGHSGLTDIKGLDALVHVQEIRFEGNDEEAKSGIHWEISPNINVFKSARSVEFDGNVIFDAKNASFTDESNSPLSLAIHIPVKNVEVLCKEGCPNIQGLDWIVQIMDENPHTLTIPFFPNIQSLKINTMNSPYFWGLFGPEEKEQSFLGNTELINLDNLKKFKELEEIDIFVYSGVRVDGSEEVILPVSDKLKAFSLTIHKGSNVINLEDFSGTSKLENFSLSLAEGYASNINEICSKTKCSRLKTFSFHVLDSEETLDLKRLHHRAPNLEELSVGEHLPVNLNGQTDLSGICPDNNKLNKISTYINSKQNLKPLLRCNKLKYLHLRSTDFEIVKDIDILYEKLKQGVIVSYYFPENISCDLVGKYRKEHPDLGYWWEASEYGKQFYSKEKLKEFPKWDSIFSEYQDCIKDNGE